MVVSHLAGCPTMHVGDAGQPHLLAAGSVLAKARPSSRVWGAGFMHPGQPAELDTAHVWALRGKLSAAQLVNGGVDPGDVPLGDPGFLAPAAFSVRRSTQPAFELGIVPHYVDRFDTRVRRIVRHDGVCEVDVHADPADVIATMAQCGAIASSSLHGLIFAEALGIPSLWIKVSDEVAGGDYKFLDWYSTADRPVAAAHQLTFRDTVEELVDRAALCECTIDVEALTTALSPERIEQVREESMRRLKPLDRCRTAATPAFVISHNRGEMMRQCIASLRDLDDAVDVVVHDNGSDDPSTNAYLDELALGGIAVHRKAAIHAPNQLNQVNETVAAYFEDWAEPQTYLVTDCDIDMSTAAPDALRAFRQLLNRERTVSAVGPMIRVRDIPHDYTLRGRAIDQHVMQFWSRPPEFREIDVGLVAVNHCLIDTSLALHRAGEPFRRKKVSLRVYEPYDCRHLDWYLSPEEVRNQVANSRISHWRGSDRIEQHDGEQTIFRGYWDVVWHDGAFTVEWRPVDDDQPVQPVRRAWRYVVEWARRRSRPRRPSSMRPRRRSG